jgi:hypothetical protein
MSVLWPRGNALSCQEQVIDRRVDLLRGYADCLLSALLAALRHRRVQRRGVEVSAMRCPESLIRRIVRSAALGAFIFYLAWNAAWIAHGRIPPSILKAMTGIPCPTTGGYRSFLALCRGEFVQSFLYNPLMLVYLLLFCYSMGVLLLQWIRRQRLVLRPLIAWMWCASLLIGWAAKFALGRQYW